MALEKIQLSLITPCLNEETILPGFIAAAESYLQSKKVPAEIIIVENGSSDKTVEVARGLQKKYKNLVLKTLPEGNKGLALKTGINSARGEKIITLDTDLWDEAFIEKSISLLSKNDIVIGSKNAPGASDERSFLQRVITKAYNFCFRLVFNLKATDTKARLSFRREAILPIVGQCQTDDLIFDTELLIRSERAGLRITEVPGAVREIRGQRYSVRKRWRKIVADFLTLVKVLKPSPNWSYVIVFGAVLLGIFLRFHNFTDWFFFEVDEEHYSFMTRMITVNHHFPLIGGPISGTKLYMAPWFLYFSSAWYFISGNSPIFFGIITTLLGLGTIWLIYLVGKKISSPGTGAIGALLYSSSFLMVIFDRHQWNVTLLPLISVATMYLLIRWLEGGRKWLVFAALVVTFGISSTFTAFAVFLFALGVVFTGKRPFLKKDLWIFLGIVAAGHLSLVLFDLRHDFWLTKAFIDFSTHPASSSVPLFTRVTNTFSLLGASLGKALVIHHPLDLADEASICTTGIVRFVASGWSMALATLMVAGYLWLFIKKRLGRFAFLPIVLLVVNVLSLVFFRADPSERHWLPFYPLFFLMTGSVAAYVASQSRWLKISSLIVIAALVCLNTFAFLLSWSSYGWTDKNAAVRFIISHTTPGKFYLAAAGDACHEWGYRYQFSQLGHEPSGSYIDYDFTWMYNTPPAPAEAVLKATILAPNKSIPESEKITKQRQALLKDSFTLSRFGNVEVYLEKNR